MKNIDWNDLRRQIRDNLICDNDFMQKITRLTVSITGDDKIVYEKDDFECAITNTVYAKITQEKTILENIINLYHINKKKCLKYIAEQSK